jgi:branched-chain amino acid transport system permease protein
VNQVRRLPEFLAPALLILATAWLGLEVSGYLEPYFLDTLVKVAIVVALYLFVGNSGVLSFGQISFVALGAWTAGLLTMPESDKRVGLPGLSHFLLTTNTGNVASLALAAVVGGVAALLVGLPLMRLSGLAAGIATFAVLEITNNVLTNDGAIGPSVNNFSAVPATTGIWQAAVAGLICVAVAYAYQRTRFGRMLRATREDPAAAAAAGISIYRQRLLAFTLSGALAGLAGGIYIHLEPLGVEDLYLDLTFVTLAMLVIGGLGSLLGAVIGSAVLVYAQPFITDRAGSLGIDATQAANLAPLVYGVLLVLIMLLAPRGLVGSLRTAVLARRGR